MSHDQNFKNLIVDYPIESVQFFAADEAAEVDREARIIPTRQKQLKERLGDRFRELDVPLLRANATRIPRRAPGGDPVRVRGGDRNRAVLHRSLGHHLAHYCLDLAELFKTDRVVPVAIFLREGRRTASLTLGGDRYDFLSFRYLACALKELNWRDWRDSDNIVARLNLPNMRYQQEERVDVFFIEFRTGSSRYGGSRNWSPTRKKG